MTREKGDLSKNVIASEAKQSCGIAGDGQIAAPFGLAMTRL